MAFTFGGVKDNSKPKDLTSPKSARETLVIDHFREGEKYYLFVLDKYPTEANKTLLTKALSDYDINSYVIVNAVDCDYVKEDLKGQGLYEFIKMHRTNWRDYIFYKGIKCDCIIPFGPAMYSANGSTDIIVSDFYDDVMGRPYYYLGHEIYKYDSYFYPVDAIDELWPVLKNSTSSINMKTKFFFSQLQNVKQERWKPILLDADPQYISITSKEEADEVFKKNMNKMLVAFDTETNGFKFYNNFIHCLTICWDGIHGYYIPWELVDKKLLEENLMSCKHRTGANPKFDLKFFWHHGVSQRVNVTDATDRLAHCLFSDLKSGLKPLSYRYTPFGGYDIALDNWKKETKCNDYTKIPTDILSKYATMDALSTWRIQVELWMQCDEIDKKFPNEKFKDWTIRRWYETQMMPIYQEICKVEYRGIYVNRKIMDEYREKLLKDIEKKDKEIRKIFNVDKNFKLTSSTELGKLFERLGWTCFGRNKEGNYLTDDDAMKGWIREERPGIKLLSEYRTEMNAVRSYLGMIDENGEETGWLQYMYNDKNDGNPEEGGTWSVKQSYLVMGTETYRFIGKDPNFQNIPTRSKYATYVKQCIDTPPADLYTIEGKDGEYKLAEFEFVYTNKGYKTAKECYEDESLEFIEDDPQHSPVIRCGFDRQEDGKYKKPNERIWFMPL